MKTSYKVERQKKLKIRISASFHMISNTKRTKQNLLLQAINETC